MAERISEGAPTLGRRLAAEALGAALLLASVVGSGIMGERLSGGNSALALLANSLATGAVLIALILTFWPVSGAHLNPAVTLAASWWGDLPWDEAPAYIAVQVVGAFIGVGVANLMFALPPFSPSQHARHGAPQLLSEFVATFGLVSVISGCARRPRVIPVAVGSYIAAAYWFTASTSFANPAVTVARAATDTFAGIRPIDVPGFVSMQLLGGSVAAALWRWLAPAAGIDERRTP